MLAKFLEKVLILLRYCFYGVASYHKPVQHCTLKQYVKCRMLRKGILHVTDSKANELLS